MLNIKGPISNTGYGVATKNVIKELYKRNVNMCVIPISNNVQVDQCDISVFQEVLKKKDMPYYDGTSLKIWHQNDLMDHVGGGKRIGWPIFELHHLTEVECHHVGYCDNIIVCSEWAKEVVINSLYNRYKWSSLENVVKVVPLGVDTSIFYHQPSNHTPTRFFNCGKWEIRKGHDILKLAFQKAFKPSDNVELYLMCNNPFPQVDNNAWRRYYQDSPMVEKTFFVETAQSHEEVANIMRQMDCGVFPARAEGFNLELLECMACGLEVITTDYSAHTEYCNESNARLLTHFNLQDAFDGIWFKNQGKWAEITEEHIDHIVEYMRNIHKYKQSGRNIINTHGIKTAKKFSWSNTVDKLLEII